jgi:hypothetical protein
MFLIGSVPPNSYTAMANILRSSFSPLALMRIPKPSVKMTKILEQLFAFLRCSILNDIKLARSLLQSLLDLMRYQNRDRRNQPSAWPPVAIRSRLRLSELIGAPTALIDDRRLCRLGQIFAVVSPLAVGAS